jgi:hypothetical protein
MDGGSKRKAAIADVALTGLAFLLVAGAIAAGRAWAESHFLPAWAWSWDVEMEILLVLRLAVAAAGFALLLVVRPWLGGAIRAGRGRMALGQAALALAAAFAGLAAAEAILHLRSWRSTQERWDQQPLRARDPEIGWTFVPDRAGSVAIGGRTIHYAVDGYGDRVRAPGARTDLSRPTILFGGESIILGFGLEYDETIPARVAAITGIQSTNLAVNAYSSDQALMRLARALPHFARPVAVVTIFVPTLIDRNLDRDRPHLGPDLRWIPAEAPPFRLVELARRLTRYRSLDSMRDGLAMTRAALRRTIALARARHVPALILVPQIGPESDRERAVRRQVLDEAHIPYLRVLLDDRWRIPGDRHPDARADHAIADAVAAALRLKRQ